MVNGPWTVVSVSFTASTMLLLTDGRVMCQEENRTGWWLLTPDSTGSYARGTWKPAAPMSKDRLYYASAVLKDGRVAVLGGEYVGDGPPVEDGTGEVYDPVADAWSPIPASGGWSFIGDAPCAVLPDGGLLLGSIMTPATAVWDSRTSTWSDAGTKLGWSAEESWVLLPGGSVLTVDCVPERARQSELWVAGSGWIDAGSLPEDIVEQSSEEIGPALLLADGRAIFFGATGHTAVYNPAAAPGRPGEWTAGPDLPIDSSRQQVVAKDSPAVLMPNGHVLLAASSEGQSSDGQPGWGGPTNFYDVDPTATPIAIEAVPPASGSNRPPFEGRLLLLPDGEVIYTQGSAQVYFFDPEIPAPAVAAPVITNAPSRVAAGGTFDLAGTGFNGVSQSVAYGDDAAAATNYPLARLTNGTTGLVTYARTHDHSTMAVATGPTQVTTRVTLPASIPAGSYTLEVVANGEPSRAVPVEVSSSP